jgi:hypothetical protein
MSLHDYEQMQPAAPSLRSMYEAPRRSEAWELGVPEIVKFWADDGCCYGFMWHALSSAVYIPEHQRLMLGYGLGALVITGPKIADFFEDFCSRKVVSVKADGKDLLSVVLHLRTEKQQQED